ncbi:protein arginine methyltransferase NDUFAF7, mitochondrial isoform X2 [Gallus gallus]|uniref:protein arginine methyltransferase NDUFAF7, mitochondrial isoform X2 n=1 Tax=Gallus gallus TaxID=9031 RepID=UPI001AE524F3|nr:protein arginine methyltransferase NDUFAF7, mitochondrial isoform X2 [Gallus gallus]XP_040522842.1 protein arginine methyltransferase NDUFAF7, mitochondrial isoform X2 [Gallus gallus]
MQPIMPPPPACRALLATALGLAGRHRLPCHRAPLAARLSSGAGGEVEAAGSGEAGGVLRHLLLKLRATGPVTVAEYMREALTNPGQGYYTRRGGVGEDFITSPEISQIFGEVFNQLASLLSKCDVSIHLVEVSPKLSAIQAEMLTGGKVQSNPENKSAYMKGISKTGIPIYWYRDIQDVPQGYSFYLAHEFLDALPIHKFQRTEKGWHEVLVDIDPEVPDQLRFVLSPSRTPATENFIQPEETRDHVEVCPEAGVLIQRLACRIEKDGGAALIADYGHDGTKTDTFRGFRNHKLHDVLKAPGTADLTADVDFSYLRKMAEGRTATLGPIKQREFLKNMGIDLRLQVLLQHSRDSATHEQLLHSFDMLMNPKKMGDCFHFFALLPHHRVVRPTKKDNPQSKSPLPPVAGFGELSLK